MNNHNLIQPDDEPLCPECNHNKYFHSEVDGIGCRWLVNRFMCSCKRARDRIDGI